MVHHRLGNVDTLPACQLSAPGQIHVLAVGDQILVEEAHFVQHGPAIGGGDARRAENVDKLAAGYILWMIQRTFYGPALEQYDGVKDADILERVYMFAFVALIMLVGIYPAILTDIIELGISPIAGLLGG